MLRHKFNAKSCEYDGRKFPSKLEGRYYLQLKARQKEGEIIFFLCQIPFHLPGNIKYVCDFCVYLANGEVEFVECKGQDLPLGKLKRKLVENLYPITIKVVTNC